MLKPSHLRKELPALPLAMKSLPLDWRGYPVPYFVAWIKGQPDHRIVEPGKLVRAVRQGLCWVCGKPLAPPVVCVIRPMCAVNRINSEPPCHEPCARFAVQGCPFLARPHMVRREAGMPETEPLVKAPGNMLMHNPGVMLLWWTAKVSAFKHGNEEGSHNLLFDIGDPLQVEWWTEGRPATRDECEAAIVRGLPNLFALAQSATDTLYIQHKADELRALLPA